jgi:hypothetical protein
MSRVVALELRRAAAPLCDARHPATRRRTCSFFLFFSVVLFLFGLFFVFFSTCSFQSDQRAIARTAAPASGSERHARACAPWSANDAS